MKALIPVFAALLLASGVPAAAADGDGVPFRKCFSLELGTGIQPLHMTLAPSHNEERALAQKGQAFNKGDDYFCPILSLSEVWRFAPHWEFCLTEGIGWKHMPVIQYDTFGVGPSGEPRYDLSKGSPAGWKATRPIGSLTAHARFIWSPKWAVTVYSALGVGLTTSTYYIPLPSVTPIALRIGKKHFYGFAEVSLGPVATIAHGGFGWKF